jgi:peptidoglycan/xylan/chitin deacetylase (PgdA/CDA1 family)
VRSVWLMYHDVYSREPQSGVPRSASMYHLSQAAFLEHLRAIKASGRTVVTAREFLSSQPQESVVLTFDDGWRGAFEIAVPLLAEFGWRATFFITRDLVGRNWFCERSMLVEAVEAGMELGVHGTDHRMLSACTRAEVVAQFSDCKAFLESIIGRPVEAASLPGGDVNGMIVSCARQAGLRSLCTSRPGVNQGGTSPFALRRIGMRPSTGGAEISRYCQYNVRSELARWAVFQGPRTALGMRNYSRLRRWILGEHGDGDTIFQP